MQKTKIEKIDAGLPAEKLPAKIIQELKGIIPYRSISFTSRISIAITSNSVAKKIPLGYMGRENAIQGKIGDKTWLISEGKVWGNYPEKPYIGDILATEISSGKEMSREDIQTLLQSKLDFCDSVVIIKNDGSIIASGNPKNRFNQTMHRFLQSITAHLVIPPSAVNEEVYAAMFEPLQILYKTNSANILAEQIKNALSAT